MLPASVQAATPEAEASATCSDYSNQADAQRAADTRDGDGDGIYCEALPCPCLKPGSGGGGSPKPKPKPRKKRKRAQTIRSRITRVVDGDTIKVHSLANTKRRNYTARLIGIDTPETKKPGTPIECGGREATSSMFALSFTSPKDTNSDGLLDKQGGKGRKVTLVTDPTQDKFDRYHRLLAYVTAGGRTFEGTQLGRGWAKVYVFKKRFRRYQAFKASQADARDNDRGVWGLCNGHFHTPATASVMSAAPGKYSARYVRNYLKFDYGRHLYKAEREAHHLQKLNGIYLSCGHPKRDAARCQWRLDVVQSYVCDPSTPGSCEFNSLAHNHGLSQP